ncbi:hypothetical protein [Vibrio phage vB_VhaP_PG11]|nr:hypothetical protein [Vibrio phage vB_VhaP_PG11]
MSRIDIIVNHKAKTVFPHDLFAEWHTEYYSQMSSRTMIRFVAWAQEQKRDNFKCLD